MSAHKTLGIFGFQVKFMQIVKIKACVGDFLMLSSVWQQKQTTEI